MIERTPIKIDRRIGEIMKNIYPTYSYNQIISSLIIEHYNNKDIHQQLKEDEYKWLMYYLEEGIRRSIKSDQKQVFDISNILQTITRMILKPTITSDTIIKHIETLKKKLILIKSETEIEVLNYYSKTKINELQTNARQIQKDQPYLYVFLLKHPDLMILENGGRNVKRIAQQQTKKLDG